MAKARQDQAQARRRDSGGLGVTCSVTDCDCTDFERDKLEGWAVEALADQFSVCVCGHEEDEHGV